jgi:hypothetical protein
VQYGGMLHRNIDPTIILCKSAGCYQSSLTLCTAPQSHVGGHQAKIRIPSKSASFIQEKLQIRLQRKNKGENGYFSK